MKLNSNYFKIIALLFLSILLIGFFHQPIVATFCGISSGNKFSIIMYHNISQKQNLLGKYVVSDKQFEEDLKYIKNNGYQTITMTQLVDYVYHDGELPENPIMITFDDGYESFYAYAFPLLKKYQMSAVVSIVGEYTDLYSEKDDHNLDYSHLNWVQINEMTKTGLVEIQNHTYDLHKICNGRKGCGIKCHELIAEYKKELSGDIEKLQSEILAYTGISANTFTYPYGYICKESLDIIKELGFKAILTCTEHANTINYQKDWLYDLGRYNRPHGKTSEQFFEKVLDFNN